MTEAEWLTYTDPQSMLEFLRGKASERKLRLFAVACCRRIWAFINDPGSRAFVEITEQAADRLLDVQKVLALDFDRLTDDCGGPEEPFRSAFMVAGHVGYDLIAPVHGFRCVGDTFRNAVETAASAVQTMAVAFDETDDKLARCYDSETLLSIHRKRLTDRESASRKRRTSEQIAQSSLLRCIFGNPFRPFTFDPSWLTSGVDTLAQTIYDERAFDRLPSLADALEQAGCDDTEILGHCRQPGAHVRGCWVVDLLLGKE